MNPLDTLTTYNPRSYDLARATVGDCDVSENQERLRSRIAAHGANGNPLATPAVDSFTSHRVNCSQCVTGELCGKGYGLLMVAQMELEAA